MTYRIYQLQQGVPITSAPTIQLLPSGLVGTRGALRTLVHPTSATFPQITYYKNPDVTVNYDSDTLRTPIVDVVRTLSSSKLVRFEEVVEDVVVQEIWQPGGGLSMPVFLFRQLYEYVLNPPPFDTVAQTYIQWAPRDRSDQVFDVQLIGLQAGNGGYRTRYFQARGGPNDAAVPGPVLTPTDTMDVSPTAIMDEVVTLTIRIVAEV